MRSHSYPGSGRCIYCVTEFGAAELTDEHIIPLALNGGLIIRDAACETCRDRSNRVYEQPALNADFLVPRLLLELKRRKKSQPKLLPPLVTATSKSGETFTNLQVPTPEHPKMIWLNVLQPPGRVSGEERGADLGTIQGWVFGFDTVDEMTFQKAEMSLTMHHTAVALTLAKIGYCFAVAELGIDGFDGSDIRDLLQGKRGDVYNFVGSASNMENLTTRHLHGLYFRRREKWRTVLVHLFASCEMRPYEVVVGPYD